MGIGGSIFLIVLGAIFAFALEVNLGWLDLRVVGWVLMFGGLAGLLLTTWFWRSRRRTVVTRERVVPAPAPVTRTVPVQYDPVTEEYREVRRTRRTV